ncbi:MAG: hypothetical protein JSR77_02100 [Planctomycetes bacterium]|nr:hypothetical protein [Planctomycetota bacterium]
MRHDLLCIRRSLGYSLLGIGLAAGLSAAQTRTYTTDADFDLGSLVNLNHNPPFNNQLQLNPFAEPFPFICVACSDRGSIVRIETNTGQVLGEYWSAPDGRGRNPSRTTVDLYGNVWCGNRNENANGAGSVVKIGVVIGGLRGDKMPDGSFVPNANGEYLQPPFYYSTAVDRDGDGLIRTSRGLGNILGWPNTGGADNNGGVSTANDEAIIVYARTPNAAEVRHVSIDRDNNVWAGGFPGYNPAWFLKLNGDTGAVMSSVNVAARFGCGGYGGLVDGNGILWSASLNQRALLRYDPATDTGAAIPLGRLTYGMGADVNGNIWNANWTDNSVFKLNPAGGVFAGFPKGLNASGGRGVAITPTDNNVWIATSYSNAVVRMDNDGNIRKIIGVGDHPTGVAVDANGKVWVTNYNSSTVMRINPVGGGDALGAVDLTVPLGGGAGPYNYSDMTGSVAVGITSQQGSWDIVYDSALNGMDWGTVSWHSVEPTGTAIAVVVRAADTHAGLAGVPFRTVANGVPFNATGVNGRYIEVRTTLSRSVGVADTPVLQDLTIRGPAVAAIDITPNITPNKIVVGKPYTVYVALLGSPTLDVRQVFPASIRFGRTGVEAVPVRAGSVVDVNRDGTADLLLGFRTIDCGFTPGNGTGMLRATLANGVIIEGVDSVAVSP